METSIIIRVRNEKETLSEVLQILKKQTYQDFEIVIVNDNSTDGSEEIIYEYFPKQRTQVLNIQKGKFTYPYAANLGAKKSKGKYLVLLSAHSFPITNTWLEDGLRDFTNDSIAGVFAWPLSGKNGTIAEKLQFDLRNILVGSKKRIFTKPRLDLLGFTNAIIRKDLWEKHPLDEAFSKGVEDVAWAIYHIKHGYKIVQDPKFRVYHSHKLSLKKLKERRKEWKKAAPDSVLLKIQ